MILHVTPQAGALRPQIDAVIFDMDGVLLDIARSIRQVNCLSVPYYLRAVLGWPVSDDLLTSGNIELFKHAGGFNDDWDLTYALVLHYLCKGRPASPGDTAALNARPPTLAQYAGRIHERGGWLRAAEEICFEDLRRSDRLAVEADYRKPIIRQVFQELLAGEHCRRLYGFPAELYHGRGYINDDRVLLDLAKVPTDKSLGVLTGRTYEEAQLGLEFTDLSKIIPETRLVTKRDGFHKPQPGGLVQLAERLGFRQAVYIGDTLDDLRTVRNFNAGDHAAVFLAALVLTGPAGDANLPLFREAGADLIAGDVNAVLDWLAGSPGRVDGPGD